VTTDQRSRLRKEDEPLLRASGRFVADVRLPGMLHAAFVRSPYPHARIVDRNLLRAIEHPGVVAVLTGADIADSLRIPIRQFAVPGMEKFLQAPLATDRVRYVGDPVAVVVAADRYKAEDACELVEIAYELLEPILDVEMALAPGAPLLFPDAGTNVSGQLFV
jgi:carbon-monoxide dehydrogenase large subunit